MTSETVFKCHNGHRLVERLRADALQNDDGTIYLKRVICDELVCEGAPDCSGTIDPVGAGEFMHAVGRAKSYSHRPTGKDIFENLRSSDVNVRREFFTSIQFLRALLMNLEAPYLCCPCCGFPTLPERSAYDICFLCGWEDDGQDDARADEVWGGPNHDYSLTEARENFRRYFTQYRPGDEPHFSRTISTADAKKQIVALYDGLAKEIDSKKIASLLQDVDAIVADMRKFESRTS